jgi:uncharacterized protein YgbK (DUF1537 family)
MEPRWLILADDLTGAADTAIAFARRRLPAKVVWGDSRPQDHVDTVALAYDLATRELDAPAAARRHGEVLRKFLIPGMRVFKKVDSTLRGHPAEEIAAMLDVLLADTPRVRVVMAPSFPATGRTVRGGDVHVHGIPLPFTEYWPQGRDPAFGNLGSLLESAGVYAHPVSLSAVRGPAVALAAAFAKGVAICDAETDDDLDRVAAAVLDANVPTFCIGSAGLAHALARCASRGSERRSPPVTRAPSARGALVVVGSRTHASRTALEKLLALEQVDGFSIDPALLDGDLESAAHAALTTAICNSIARGSDVAVDIGRTASSRNAGNPRLVLALARLLVSPARQASALVATGGETAAALLNRLGVGGLRLVDEIEPGIPLGLTLGEFSVPAVTKAGGFGNDECLTRILTRLRFIRQTGAVA